MRDQALTTLIARPSLLRHVAQALSLKTTLQFYFNGYFCLKMQVANLYPTGKKACDQVTKFH